MIKAIIFDWNGTLINDIRFHVKTYAQAFREAGAKNKDLEEFFAKYLGNISKSVFEKVAYEKTGIRFSDKMMKRKTELYLEIVKSMKDSIFFPGIMDALNRLKGRYRMAIVSGSDEYQITSVLPENLRKMFAAIVADEGKIKPKPEPDMLLLAAERMEVKPSECVYVGDAEYDMIAAKKAGMKAIGVTTGNFSAEDLRKAGADFTGDSMNTVIKIIDGLND